MVTWGRPAWCMPGEDPRQGACATGVASPRECWEEVVLGLGCPFFEGGGRGGGGLYMSANHSVIGSCPLGH